MPELKSCPFCGDHAKADCFYDPYELKWEIVCLNNACGSKTKEWETNYKAIEAWNKRK